MIPKIAVIGEGVIGCTSALQIAKAIPNSRITILHDKPFEKSCSAGPAGLFRIDYEENTEYGRASFAWFSHLYRTTKGAETGVKLVSGHIQSDNLESLKQQQRAYGDIVYNFRFLDDRERLDMFPEPSKHCIHHTAYASEGNKYVPYLKNLLLEQKVEFKQQEVKSLDEEPKILKEWSALRPGRKHVRIEAQKRTTEGKGKEYTVVHHYGHGSNGFTLGWGTAIEATKLVQKALGLM
ncbi:CBN-DDO-2 protein [Caenorhabditis brenneri]|uniref:CBN-DDO-2 protein n=1 Tax=Caenorhabditis brenneri TaxID=135651 RepID=G0N0V4_CAEBE|nr:CBN-DDO-2 protein [Caenorhabditis brenneri]